jgi:alpha-beta hydrolase superfamily lysophospholipase
MDRSPLYNPPMNQLQGTDFLYRRWDATSPKAVVLLVHGLGGHSARWDFLASHLAAEGYASYGLELRGYGATPERPRGHIDSFKIYDRDILALRDAVLRDHPGRKVFLLGESLGGLIVFNLAARRPDAFAGTILVSAVFKNGMKFPLSSYLTLVSQYLFNAEKTIPVPFDSAMCTRDAAYQAVMDANPDESREASLKLLMCTLGAQRRARRLSKKLSVPTLFLVAGIDKLVDAPAERRMFAKLPLADKTLREYPGMHHALSIDLGREDVFGDIVGWLNGRI